MNIEKFFSSIELELAREQYLSEQAEEIPLPQVKFRYAKALMKSRDAKQSARNQINARLEPKQSRFLQSLNGQ
uniref:AlNc14C326G10640 protein n=1 Tax=Albugo laibachii Nc14 TaxID=890382 RepID=F0WGF0_9STRA|nr:AlNc14C91G5682 [Albugo laibachii Nc14]CCA25852.1 AlNc14C326G10640 [Albugo laibachii Nc14]|eukprot:CCA25852.1 AlNc14C326G10640 [Albugo laibachii Nc14]